MYRLALPTSKELQYHRFRQGDNILLSPMDSLSMGQTRGSAGSAKGTAAAARARLARGRGADGQGQRASSEGDSDSDDEQDWAGIDGVVLELRRGHLMVAVEGKQADVIQRLSTAGAGGRCSCLPLLQDTCRSGPLCQLPCSRSAPSSHNRSPPAASTLCSPQPCVVMRLSP